MSKQVWKFTLRGKVNTIGMPKGAQVLAVATQQGNICIWALVEPDAPVEPRHFNIYGTGLVIPSSPGNYIGTVLIHNDALMFHVFEELP